MNHTLKSIHARCIEVGDCWEWQGKYSGHNGRHPYIRHNGNNTTARRVVLDLAGKKPKHPNQDCAMSTCDNWRCVNPAHLKWATRSETMKVAGAKGLLSDPPRLAKIAAAKRAKAKLTLEQVHDIRTSTERNDVLAARYQVHYSYISNIKHYRLWRDHTATPFSGLGART